LMELLKWPVLDRPSKRFELLIIWAISAGSLFFALYEFWLVFQFSLPQGNTSIPIMVFYLVAAYWVVNIMVHTLCGKNIVPALQDLERALVLRGASTEEVRQRLETLLLGKDLGLFVEEKLAVIEKDFADAEKFRKESEARLSVLSRTAPPHEVEKTIVGIRDNCKKMNAAMIRGLRAPNRMISAGGPRRTMSEAGGRPLPRSPSWPSLC